MSVDAASPGDGGDYLRLDPPSRRLQVYACMGLAAWWFVFLAGLAWIVLISSAESVYCAGRLSQIGELRWSLAPPGPTCVFDRGAGVDGNPRQRGPSPMMSIWLATLIAIGVTTWLLVRALRLTPAAIARAWRAASVVLAAFGAFALMGLIGTGSALLFCLAPMLFGASTLAWGRAGAITWSAASSVPDNQGM